MRPLPHRADHPQIKAVRYGSAISTTLVAHHGAMPRSPRWGELAAQPGLTVPRPATSVIAERPVFADQVSAGLWSCKGRIAMRNGLVLAETDRR